MKNIKILTDALTQWDKRYRSFGDYSVTTLLNPPRMVQLNKRHKNDVVRTPEQQIAAFIGSGVHLMFEESLKLQAVLEPEYSVERTVYDKIEDRLITGKFDILWNERHLYDVKTARCWKKVFDPDMVEWHEQLNIYALMLHNRGLDIRSINIIACYLDWDQKRSFRNEDYPQTRVVEYQLSLWPWEDTDKFLRSRINLMKEAENLNDEHLPFCTDEEMWVRNKEIEYAIMASKDAGRALRVCSTLDEAKQYAAEKTTSLKPGAFIEVRKPIRKRCEDWCDAAPWCQQFKEYAAKKESGNYWEKVTL